MRKKGIFLSFVCVLSHTQTSWDLNVFVHNFFHVKFFQLFQRIQNQHTLMRCWYLYQIFANTFYYSYQHFFKTLMANKHKMLKELCSLMRLQFVSVHSSYAKKTKWQISGLTKIFLNFFVDFLSLLRLGLCKKNIVTNISSFLGPL